VNPVVHPRHNDLANLVWYLFKEGKDDDHADARLVAVWDGAGELDQLEPPTGPDDRRDVRRLMELLAQPLRAARNPPRLTVWHCSIRNAPEDRVLSDPVWAEIARQVMDATKLAPIGDAGAVRWIAVRHSPNHIHLAATLVRQDGYTAWGWQDKINSRRRCDELELRYGLRRVGPADRTGHRRPSGAEVNKAKRLGQALPARDELRRHVRAAAAASANEEEFFARLADAGVLVSLRPSVTNPGEITGYSVALPTNTNAAGEPVYFGGSRLARDLTLPKLRQRWASPDGQTPSSDGPVRISTQARIDALNAAAEAVRGAADAIGRLAGTDPRAAVAIAQATSDTLAAIAAAVEGRRGGPITAAVDLFDHAAREPNGAVAPANQGSWDLRAMSRLVHLMGRLSGDKDTFAVLVLLLDLARLADTLASLRHAQQRYHQAEAALRAAESLRSVAATTTGRLGAAPTAPVLDLTDVPPAQQPAARPVAEPPTRDEPRHRGR
jgi:hypothetical protein